MNTKLFFLLLFFPLSLSAQWKHELTVDAASLVDADPGITYEIISQSRWSLLFGTTYQIDKAYISYPDDTTMLGGGRTSETFRYNILSFNFSGKYYISSIAKSERLYFGFQLQPRIKAFLDKNYEKRYLELSSKAPPVRDKLVYFYAGLTLGYKWVIRKKFVLEPFYIHQWNLVPNAISPFIYPKSKSGFNLRVGYRFGNSKSGDSL